MTEGHGLDAVKKLHPRLLMLQNDLGHIAGLLLTCS
jgi:hypothetical protein